MKIIKTIKLHIMNGYQKPKNIELVLLEKF